MDAHWIDLPVHDAKRGHLVALEPGAGVPFPIRRVFCVWGQDPRTGRGRHAHRRGEQVFVCLSGSCRLTLRDGRGSRSFALERPDRGLHVGPLLWEEFDDFAPGTVLLVVASTPYEKGNYIADFAAFLRLASGHGNHDPLP